MELFSFVHVVRLDVSRHSGNKMRYFSKQH